MKTKKSPEGGAFAGTLLGLQYRLSPAYTKEEL
jgi:hypothetical protein